jgi:hypothetical protein
MFKYTNLISKYSNFSYSGHPFNKIQILNIAQHDIYPRFNDYIKNDKPTNIIVSSGKVLINFKKEAGKGKYYTYKSNDSMISNILFAEPNILCETKVSTNEFRNKSNYNINNEYCNYNDLVNVLTNKKYVITILPHVYFSFYSREHDTSLMVMSNE